MSDATGQQTSVSSDMSNTQQATDNSPAGATSQASSGEGLKCEWQGCTSRLPNAEALYDHVCETHVGRKSTNNLNLTCAWGNCRTTTVKRDHITSHIRVHVPLKPHKCDYCQKAFKRPQDLKKHVKTHAEDPNYASPAEASRSHQGGPGNVFGGTRHGIDLQHMAATATGYYPDGQHMAPPGAQMYQGYANGGTPNAGYHHQGQYQANYMTTALYPVTSSSASQEYELRKKATFDALNEFFGDLKSRSIDPTVYSAVGQRLMSLQNVPSYVGSGDYGAGTAVASAPRLPPGHNHYSLPTIRTKNDLVNVDMVLEQLQSTVYDHETALQGVQLPSAHTIIAHPNQHPHVTHSQRNSLSPPRGSNSSSISATDSISFSNNTLPPLTTTAALDTPALTPASTVMSHSSPQSSAADRISLSPTNRPELLYPAVTSGGYPMTSLPAAAMSAGATAMPSSVQHSLYDHHQQNIQSGRLGRAVPSTENTSGVLSDDTVDSIPIGRLGVRSPSVPNVDPALWDNASRKSSGSAHSRDSATPTIVKEEDDSNFLHGDPEWLVKVRVLESLRAYIRHRLDNHMWDDEAEEQSGAKSQGGSSSSAAETGIKASIEHEPEIQSLYPVLRAVQGDE